MLKKKPLATGADGLAITMGMRGFQPACMSRAEHANRIARAAEGDWECPDNAKGVSGPIWLRE